MAAQDLYVFPFYDRPATLVERQVSLMTEIAEKAVADTNDQIERLASLTIPPEGAPPHLQIGEIIPGEQPDIDAPDPQLFGQVGGINAPDFEDFQGLISAIGTDDPPTFNPSIVALSIPAVPAPIDTSGLPVRPTINDVALPADPNAAVPAESPLLQIDIPGRPTITLPAFDADLQPFDEAVPTIALDWAEPVYTPTTLTELASTIKAMLTGEFGMPAGVQEALFAAAREREDTTARAATENAYADYAARGFSMPPGMLVEQVNVAREKSQLQANALSRDVLTKAAQWQIDNLRTAVSEGVALESVLIQQHSQIAQRAFEAARLRVQIEFDRFGLRVAGYNTRVAYINAAVAVFQAKVAAELSKIELFKAEIEAEQLKGQLNEQTVRIYTAKLQALSIVVDMFKAKLDAAKVKVDLERSKIEMYRVDVQAYAERLSADKVRFEAYEAQLRGEAAKVGIVEAEARAFAATVSAYESGNNVKIARVQARLRAIEVGVSKYSAELQAERERINAEVAAIQAQSSAYTAEIGRFSAELTFASQRNELVVRAAEATARNNVAYFEVVSRQYDSRQTRMVEGVRLIKEAIQAGGAMAAQTAAGALSATHTQASISGSGSASTSWSESSSYNETHTFDETE